MSSSPYKPKTYSVTIEDDIASSQLGTVIINGDRGTGKTFSLCKRIQYIITKENASPKTITICTLDNEQTTEIRNVMEALGQDLKGINIGTFHSLCCQFLRKYSKMVNINHDFQVLQDQDKMYCLSILLKEYDEKLQASAESSPRKALCSVDELSQVIAKAKLAMQTPEDYLEATALQQSDASERKRSIQFYELFDSYEKFKEASNALDYDDLLFKTVELFSKHPHVYTKRQKSTQHMFLDNLDEANVLQYEIFKKIGVSSISVTVTTLSNEQNKLLAYFKEDFGQHEEKFTQDPSINDDTTNQSSSDMFQYATNVSQQQVQEDHSMNPLSNVLTSQKVRWQYMYKNAIPLYTVLTRENAVIGYESSEDVLPFFCINIGEVERQEDKAITLLSKEENGVPCELIFQSTDERNIWLTQIESQFNERQARSYTIPQLFCVDDDNESSLIDEVDQAIHQQLSMKLPPLHYDNAKFNDVIQDCCHRFLKTLVTMSKKEAETLLMDSIKNTPSYQKNVEETMQLVQDIIDLQLDVTHPRDQLNVGEIIVNQDDLDAWYQYYTKKMGHDGTIDLQETKQQLIDGKIIHDYFSHRMDDDDLVPTHHANEPALSPIAKNPQRRESLAIESQSPSNTQASPAASPSSSNPHDESILDDQVENDDTEPILPLLVNLETLPESPGYKSPRQESSQSPQKESPQKESPQHDENASLPVHPDLEKVSTPSPTASLLLQNLKAIQEQMVHNAEHGDTVQRDLLQSTIAMLSMNLQTTSSDTDDEKPRTSPLVPSPQDESPQPVSTPPVPQARSPQYTSDRTSSRASSTTTSPVDVNVPHAHINLSQYTSPSKSSPPPSKSDDEQGHRNKRNVSFGEVSFKYFDESSALTPSKSSSTPSKLEVDTLKTPEHQESYLPLAQSPPKALSRMTPTSLSSVRKMLFTGNSFYVLPSYQPVPSSKKKKKKKLFRYLMLSPGCDSLMIASSRTPDFSSSTKRRDVEEIPMDAIVDMQFGDVVVERRRRALDEIPKKKRLFSFSNNHGDDASASSSSSALPSPDCAFSFVIDRFPNSSFSGPAQFRFLDIEAFSAEDAVVWSSAWRQILFSLKNKE